MHLRLFVYLACCLLSPWTQARPATVLPKDGWRPRTPMPARVIASHDPFDPTGALAPLPIITPEEAEDPALQKQHVHVVGHVARIGRSPNGLFFINFWEEWRGRFHIVVFPNVLAFCEHDLDNLQGRPVRITGKLRQYDGRPQIVLEAPHRLEVLSSIANSGLSGGVDILLRELTPAQAEAPEMQGKAACVTGQVVHVGRARSGTVAFLNFWNPWRGRFCIAVFAEAEKDIPGKLEDLAGQTVAVTGVVSAYKGTPQIALRNAADLKVLDSSATTAHDGTDEQRESHP